MSWTAPRSLPEAIAAVGIPGRELVRAGLPLAALSSAEACARLADWVTRGQPAPDLDALDYYGDALIGHLVAETIGTLPAPIAEHVVRVSTWLGVGATSRGWTGGWPRPRPRLIVIAASDADHLRRTIRHESGHAWLDPTPCGLLRAMALETLTAALTADSGSARRASSARIERRVEAFCVALEARR